MNNYCSNNYIYIGIDFGGTLVKYSILYHKDFPNINDINNNFDYAITLKCYVIR